MTEQPEGLLEKAKLVLETTPSTTQNFEATDPEQAEILAQINEIAAKNKIQVTPQLFKTSPSKKGFILPLTVNLSAVALLAVGLTAISMIFQTQETQKTVQAGQLQSSEGRLLKEIKRQAEASLAEKDKAILDIESRLSTVQTEKSNLATSLEAKIKQREAAMRAQIDAILDIERQKLREQGYSEAEIERRVKIIEQQKSQEYNKMLADYRRQLEADRNKSEAELRKLETQYSSQLGQVRDERERLTAESKKREEELKAKLNQEQTANQSQLSDAQKKVQAAVDQMERLNKVREYEQNLTSQISGYYDNIRDHMRAKRWAEAQKQTDLLRQMLKTPSVGESDFLAKLRNANLFVVDSLDSLIDKEKNQVDTTALLKSAGIIKEAESLLFQAQSELKAGNKGAAANTYNRVVKLFPGTEEASSFFVNEEKVRQEDLSRQSAESAKIRYDTLQAELNAQLNTSASQKQKELEDQVFAARAEAEDLRAKVDEQTKKLETASVDSKKDLKKVQDELLTLTKANTSLKKQQDDQKKEIASLETQLATAKKQVPEKADTSALDAQIADLKKQNNLLETKLTETEKKLASASAQAGSGTPLGSVVTPVSGVQSAADKEKISKLEQDLAKAQSAQNDVVALVSAYQSYTSRVRSLNPSKNAADVTPARLQLDAFLNSTEVRKFMPGIADSIRAFDQAVLNASQRSALIQVNDRIFSIASIQKKENRVTAIQKEIQAATDASQKELWQSILKFLQ